MADPELPRPGELTAAQKKRVDRIVADARRDWCAPPDPEEGVSFDVIVREAVELALVEENQSRPAPDVLVDRLVDSLKAHHEKFVHTITPTQCGTCELITRYDATKGDRP